MAWLDPTESLLASSLVGLLHDPTRFQVELLLWRILLDGCADQFDFKSTRARQEYMYWVAMEYGVWLDRISD